ncbi:MAG: ABC transporter permease [Alphaproteobacteria bacterium]|uniref:Transport permease protein n=1 Tax=Candidatus Nitrobium versatile TaxID=2884831 RepID=A0A953J5G9_9BACT|nr:ABC transporter permease [Candidatus Nitrobium versatile]
MTKNPKETITTYEPDNSLRRGYLSVFGEILAEVRQNRWLMYQLFKRDFLALYKQSLLGILWAFILPLASMALFMLLNRSGIFLIGDTGTPYPIYAVLGLSFWQLFSAGIVASSNALVKAGSMIIQINFSRKSLVLASSGQAAVSFLIQFILVLLLFAWYGIMPSAGILAVPLVVVPIVLLTLGMGFIFALLNGIFRDVGTVLSMMVTFLMFLTPVLYMKPKHGVLLQVTKYNPLYYLVSGARDLVLTGTIAEQDGFFLSVLLSVAVFLAGLVVFHLTETRIAERI